MEKPRRNAGAFPFADYPDQKLKTNYCIRINKFSVNVHIYSKITTFYLIVYEVINIEPQTIK